eukprot:CAMPEP_0170512808 /NCGR_PEP_ID=MMETSP0208-20121228/67052_1 /TAXON_ID=197538 /ORGANISM="Strombidium inclinatum, Strain S3" /LENGTH=85 /DNA_ID=CAMNT_0010796473 /DNA_START=1295 /DNA_END=1553 /DNA_ORIENTATION=-
MTYEKPDKIPRRKIQFSKPISSIYMCPSKKIHKILTPVRPQNEAPRVPVKARSRGSPSTQMLETLAGDPRLYAGEVDGIEEMSDN